MLPFYFVIHSKYHIPFSPKSVLCSKKSRVSTSSLNIASQSGPIMTQPIRTNHDPVTQDSS